MCYFAILSELFAISNLLHVLHVSIILQTQFSDKFKQLSIIFRHFQSLFCDCLGGMRFNTKKCNTMRISNSKNKDAHIYTMNGTPLKQTKNCQYLVIHIQNNLKWGLQSQHAAAKASRTLGFIQRNFHQESSNIKEKLNYTLARPQLEHVWHSSLGSNPLHSKDI